MEDRGRPKSPGIFHAAMDESWYELECRSADLDVWCRED